MVFPSSSFFHRAHGLGLDRLLLALLFIILLPISLRAEQVVLGRDGTLAFQDPSGGSTVLDILPRGTRLELVNRGEQWSEVLLPESNTRGFIRTDALQPFAETTVRTEAGISEQYTSPLFNTLQQELDKSDVKIRKIESTMDQLEKMIEMYAQSGSGMIGAPGESRRKGALRRGAGEDRPLAYSYGFHVFSGVYFEGKDFTAGGAVSWFPESLAGFGLELEGGYIAMEGDRSGASLNLSLLYPLPLKKAGLLPFIAGGGGVVRLSDGDAGVGSDNRLATHLGLGALYRLSDDFDLRGELRAQKCEDDFDGRVSLALHYGF
jgi:hypothetical protein